MNILIIQTAFLGDIVLSMFLANEIKHYLHNSKITFLSTHIGKQVAECFKYIDESICYDKRNIHKGWQGINAISKKINHEEFDYIFAIHKSFRTSILVSKIKAKHKIGFDKNSFSFLLDTKIKYKKFIHEVFRNRMLLSSIIDIPKNFNYYQLVQNNIDCFKNISNKNVFINNDDIIIAPSSVWNTKVWPKEYYAILTKMLINKEQNIYLIGSKVDIDLCNYISSYSGAVSLAGNTSIAQLLELIRNAKLVITNDSSPTHIASLFNIPTVTIFGSTSSLFGFYPLSEKSIVIENENLFCHPCNIHGSSKCYRKSFECMKNIKPETVFEKINDLL